MVSRKTKSSILNDISRIQSGLKEINEAQRSAIHLQFVGLLDMTKKHILDTQRKLDKYVEKLDELTNDSVAKRLIDTLNDQLSDIGSEYASILKFESETKTTTSDVENLEVMSEISSKLFKLLSKLQEIEDTLDTTAGDQLNHD